MSTTGKSLCGNSTRKRNPEANPLGSKQKDTRHVGKDEDGEVTEALEVEMADTSQEIVDESNTERGQESDELSRQSSAIPNVVASDSKSIIINETGGRNSDRLVRPASSFQT